MKRIAKILATLTMAVTLSIPTVSVPVVHAADPGIEAQVQETRTIIVTKKTYQLNKANYKKARKVKTAKVGTVLEAYTTVELGTDGQYYFRLTNGRYLLATSAKAVMPDTSSWTVPEQIFGAVFLDNCIDIIASYSDHSYMTGYTAMFNTRRVAFDLTPDEKAEFLCGIDPMNYASAYDAMLAIVTATGHTPNDIEYFEGIGQVLNRTTMELEDVIIRGFAFTYINASGKEVKLQLQENLMDWFRN